MNDVIKKYELAKEMYKNIGVDTEEALKRLKKLETSIQCWQGDDVRGFLFKDTDMSGGISVTGNYPNKANNFEELSSDLSKALELIPGNQRINLHAMYAVTDENVDLNELEPKHFKAWVDWAKKENVALDFNSTNFSHVLSKKGFTLSSHEENIRRFFIDHNKRSRKISEYFGKELGKKSVFNIWIPDGFKDVPYDRLAPRMRLKESLDEIFSEKLNDKYITEVMESKLFGIGVEGYTVGSSEFYLSYALKNNKSVCFDSGHFHPTESIADKLSATILFLDNILLHVSRPMGWDSDHIVTFNDELQKICEAITRNNLEDKIYIGLDFFDASVSRISAVVLAVRNVQKALLKSLLEPVEKLKEIENDYNYTERLVLTEELKSYPYGAVYDYYCYMNNVPLNNKWLDEVLKYEEKLERES